jgi:hypothetical protein
MVDVAANCAPERNAASQRKRGSSRPERFTPEARRGESRALADRP